jgi:hypothetical protein
MLLERIRVFKYLQVDSIDLGETCKLREKYGRKLNPSYLSPKEAAKCNTLAWNMKFGGTFTITKLSLSCKYISNSWHTRRYKHICDSHIRQHRI